MNSQKSIQPDFINKKIIFFDGVCNLCNGFIDFVIKRDKNKNIYYASLQSEIGVQILKEYNVKLTDNFSTIYFLDNGKLHHRSTAILYVLSNLNLFYRVFSRFSLIFPTKFRNFVYDYIAKNRYRFFGKKETCRLPSIQERGQFL